MSNDKQQWNVECCTVKIQKLVTNVAVLHDSVGTSFRVESGAKLGCLVPTVRSRYSIQELEHVSSEQL